MRPRDSSSHHWSLLVIERSKHNHRVLDQVGIPRNKSLVNRTFYKSGLSLFQVNLIGRAKAVQQHAAASQDLKEPS